MTKNNPFPAVLCGVFIACVSWFASYAVTQIWTNQDELLGVETLKALYEFENLTQFGENIERFRSLVTNEVFEQMSADNSDRVLRVYLKFNGNPSYVNIVDSRKGYIVYSLVCESIEKERLFMFAYETQMGKISSIREAELFKLPTTRGWDVDTSLMPPIAHPWGGE